MPIQRGELVGDVELGLDHAAAGAGRGDQLGQALIGLRADDQIDHRRAGNDLGPLGLGDAAGDADQHLAPGLAAGLLQRAEAAKLGIDLLGRLLADMAGVEQDEIGRLGRLHRG